MWNKQLRKQFGKYEKQYNVDLIMQLKKQCQFDTFHHPGTQTSPGI